MTTSPDNRPQVEKRLMIHVALLKEARPLIERLGLRQNESRPFKTYESADITLLISGMGTENTRCALRWLFSRERFHAALNVGTAACSDSSIRVGTPIGVSSIALESNKPISIEPRRLGTGLPALPLITWDSPVCQWAPGPPRLADMEGNAFVEETSRHPGCEAIGSIKIVSDHGSDAIPSKEDCRRWIEQELDSWLPQTARALGLTVLERPATSPVSRGKTGTRESVMSDIRTSPVYQSLQNEDRQAIERVTAQLQFSFSQVKQMIDMAVDFRTWDETSLDKRLAHDYRTGKASFALIKAEWNRLKTVPKSYDGFIGTPGTQSTSKEFVTRPRESLGFGRCPVASPRTRCCNLLTLDAVEGCAFDCSYCAIKTFYNPEKIVLDSSFARNLDALQLDPHKTYHIGTGQSSDSLLRGNADGMLGALIKFARRYPRVILELKTKSNNVEYLRTLALPPNILFTWSLNTETIITTEEHWTATLTKRLHAARAMADKGALVGFHFHPIVDYRGSDDEYAALYEKVSGLFDPEEVALVSLGTLTFTKPVIKKLRSSTMRSRVLQMPLEEIAGKFSYPQQIKQRMFTLAYNSFKKWHNKVFFYLCMEDTALWPAVFSFDYPNNEAFESAMISHYQKKIATRTAK